MSSVFAKEPNPSASNCAGAVAKSSILQRPPIRVAHTFVSAGHVEPLPNEERAESMFRYLIQPTTLKRSLWPQLAALHLDRSFWLDFWA